MNIGRLVAPLGDPAIEDFTKNLSRVNDQGKAMPGFVWLLEGGDPELGATDIAWPGDPEMFVNLTVWESVGALRDFAFSGEHRTLLTRRKEFFQKLPEAIATLWWVPAGTVPTVQEAHDRLAHFREHGAKRARVLVPAALRAGGVVGGVSPPVSGCTGFVGW